MREGLIVPIKITCKLIENAMNKYDKAKNAFVIDGFPRNEENYSGWCEALGNSAHVITILLLECPEDVSCERILKRSKLSGRVDDNKGSLIKRFETFNRETIPLLSKIEKEKKINILKVDANQDREDVFSSISLKFDQLFNTI